MKFSRLLLPLLAVALLIAPVRVSAEVNQASKVTAWVSTKTPAQNANVTAFTQITVSGKGRAGIAVVFTWKFKAGSKTCTGKTDTRGIASCKQNIGVAPYATKVTINAALTVDGLKQAVASSFTPTRPGTTTTIIGRATPTRTQSAQGIAPVATAAAVPTTVVAATEVPANNCNPSYPDFCIPPGAADYDCAGGSGNGPNYVDGPIRVLPPDPYDLDRDGDGIGCDK